MRGLELNGNLIDLGADFVREDSTAPCYRLWSIDDRHPAMLRDTDKGAAIVLEIWAVPTTGLATLLQQEPAGLCIGKVTLASGEEVPGIVGEPALCAGMQEITRWNGWRKYLDSQSDA